MLTAHITVLVNHEDHREKLAQLETELIYAVSKIYDKYGVDVVVDYDVDTSIDYTYKAD